MKTWTRSLVAPGDGASDPFPAHTRGKSRQVPSSPSGPASLLPPIILLPRVTSGSWFAFALTLQISDQRRHGICSHLPTPQHRLSPFIRDSQMLVHTQRTHAYTDGRSPPQSFWLSNPGGDQKRYIYNKFPGDATGDHILKNTELYWCFPHELVLKNHQRCTVWWIT